MENIIVSRAVLLLLVVFHMFVVYAARAVRGHINRHVLNCFIIAELVAVTAYIIYDNVCYPIEGSMFLAIIGYLFVYFMIWGTWFMYRPNAILDKDVAYRFVAYKPVEFLGETYQSGCAEVRGNLVDVLLPYDEYAGVSHPMEVKFKEVFEIYIIVSAA